MAFQVAAARMAEVAYRLSTLLHHQQAVVACLVAEVELVVVAEQVVAGHRALVAARPTQVEVVRQVKAAAVAAAHRHQLEAAAT